MKMNSKSLMPHVATFIFVLMLTFPVFGKEGMDCPNRGTDPTKFCLPGQVWSEELKQCVSLV